MEKEKIIYHVLERNEICRLNEIDRCQQPSTKVSGLLD